jgi:hypothetical protein
MVIKNHYERFVFQEVVFTTSLLACLLECLRIGSAEEGNLQLFSKSYVREDKKENFYKKHYFYAKSFLFL